MVLPPIGLNGTLTGKPACVFTSTGSMHGGQESTLLNDASASASRHVTTGLPFSHHPELMTTPTAAEVPMAQTCIGQFDGKQSLSEDSKRLAIALGKTFSCPQKLGNNHD